MKQVAKFTSLVCQIVFIPIVILHTLAYAWCKILNFKYGAIFARLDYIN